MSQHVGQRQLAEPLVSIVMATYNCEHVLNEALASVSAQTYPNWELVVCDDASTDGTAAKLDEFASEHPGQVTVLRNEVNSKLAYSLNRCLDHANGELIARMDGDDKSMPERFECQVAYLEAHPEVDLVGTAMRRFDATGLKDVVVLPTVPDKWSMRRGVPFAHATIMARRVVYETLSGYTVAPRTIRGQDWDLWFRFFDRGFIGRNLSQPHYLVREDAAAVKRRSIQMRFRTYQTTLIGYRLLGYPRRWYIRPTMSLAKGLVPMRFTLQFRRFQAYKQHRGSAVGSSRWSVRDPERD